MILSPIDAPIALASGMVIGYLYQRVLYRINPDLFVLSYGLVGLLWLNLLWATAFGGEPWFFASSIGTDSLLLALFYALSYPLWYRFGAEVMFLLVGRRPEEGGSLWLYRIEDHTEEFTPSWES